MATKSFAWHSLLKRLSATALATVAGYACLTAFAPTGARAVSVYDNLTEAGAFTIQYGCGSSPTCSIPDEDLKSENIYGSFQSMMQASTTAECVAMETFWDNNRNSSNYYEYATAVNWNYQGGYNTVPALKQDRDIVWTIGTASTARSMTWATNGGSGIVSASFNGTFGRTGEFRATYNKAANGDVTMSCYNSHGGGASSYAVAGKYGEGFGSRPVDVFNDGYFAYQNLYIRGNINYNYPTGFEGNNYNSTYVEPNPPNEHIPDIKMRGFNNWQGVFADNNFSTFDEVPFTCVGELAPIIRGELWDMSASPTVKLDDFTASATGIFTLDLPKITDEARNYKIVSWYECDDDENVFPYNHHYEFTIDKFGNLEQQTLTTSCLKDTFPYVEFDECMENVFGVVELLAFRNPNFGNEWALDTGDCATLAIFDEWLHLDNNVVCPAFSNTVRNLVTPFVLFLLGLSTIRIINRQQVNGGDVL